MVNSTITDYDAYWTNVANSLNMNFSRYGMALIMLIGNIGSTLNCFIFCQPTLRKNPCVMYFLAASISQFFTFNVALLTRMIHFAYNFTALNYNLWYCKTRFYLFYVFIAIPRYYIILASMDRYFVSSINANLRRWSSPKVAKRLIILNVIFWCIIYIQVLVFYGISTGSCTYQSGTYGLFFSLYLSIESGILPPIVMLTFGLLTLNNIRQSKRRLRPTTETTATQTTQNGDISRRDLQYCKMLFNQVCLFVILNLMNPCFLLYQTVTNSDSRSTLRSAVESFISNMTYFFVYLGFSLTFFVYTLSSPLFRRELKQLIQTKILHRRGSASTTVNNA